MGNTYSAALTYSHSPAVISRIRHSPVKLREAQISSCSSESAPCCIAYLERIRGRRREGGGRYVDDWRHIPRMSAAVCDGG